MAIVIKGLILWDQNVTKTIPQWCDGYVKYEKAEVDRLVAILKTNNCGGGGGGPCGIQTENKIRQRANRQIETMKRSTTGRRK